MKIHIYYKILFVILIGYKSMGQTLVTDTDLIGVWQLYSYNYPGKSKLNKNPNKLLVIRKDGTFTTTIFNEVLDGTWSYNYDNIVLKNENRSLNLTVYYKNQNKITAGRKIHPGCGGRRETFTLIRKF